MQLKTLQTERGRFRDGGFRDTELAATGPRPSTSPANVKGGVR